jgi:hypothetical protein
VNIDSILSLSPYGSGPRSWPKTRSWDNTVIFDQKKTAQNGYYIRIQRLKLRRNRIVTYT